MKILVIEDEVKVASFIKKGLEEEYYTVDKVYDGREGLSLARDLEYDLLIIDVMLPTLDGITIVKTLRDEKVLTPVLLLTALGDVSDKIKGLDAGADDYVTKPFAFEELMARVRALLRRQGTLQGEELRAGDLILNLQSHTVIRNDKEIELTPREYSILEYLMRNKNRVVSRTILSEHIYDYHFDSGTNVIDVYINKLRNKIDKEYDKQLLKTIRGIGYTIKEE